MRWPWRKSKERPLQFHLTVTMPEDMNRTPMLQGDSLAISAATPWYLVFETPRQLAAEAGDDIEIVGVVTGVNQIFKRKLSS